VFQLSSHRSNFLCTLKLPTAYTRINFPWNHLRFEAQAGRLELDWDFGEHDLGRHEGEDEFAELAACHNGRTASPIHCTRCGSATFILSRFWEWTLGFTIWCIKRCRFNFYKTHRTSHKGLTVVCATEVADSRERVGAVATPICTFFAYKKTLR